MVPTLDVLFVQSLDIDFCLFSTDDTAEDILVKSALQCEYSKTCLKRPLKKGKNGFQNRLSLNAGQKFVKTLVLLKTQIKTIITI